MDQATRIVDLETIDSVARAAHLWIRSRGLDCIPDRGERRALAAGLVAGLCSQLNLGSRQTEFVAYVYALLDSEGDLALPIARYMLQHPFESAHADAFERGRAEAAGILNAAQSGRQAEV